MTNRRLIPTLTLTLAIALFLSACSTSNSPKPYTLQELRSPETTAALLKRADELVAQTRQELAAVKESGDAREINAVEGNLDILAYADDQLRQTLQSNPTPKEVLETNAYAEKVIQGIENPVEGELAPPFYDLFANVILGGLFGHDVPTPNNDKPIGQARAKRESPFLYEKGRSDFFTVDELATMTPEQVSLLDISPDHPNWYDRNSWAKIRHDPLAHFEKFIEDGLDRTLHEHSSVSAAATYDMQTAQKVLFLDYIFKAATTPKGQVQDAYGGLWKIKWGPEASIASVTWQLYILAGARITNVILTNGTGPAAMTLVLADPAEAASQKPSSNLAYPTTVDEFKFAIQDFYNFDITPYIHSQGTITHANANTVLKNLPPGGKTEFHKSNLIGRNWIAFKESSIELNSDGFIRRSDGLRLSDLVASNDRVARGSFIFDMWVGNRDVKDANSDTFFPMTGPGDVTGHYEGRSDQGLTLGSLMAAGDVNQFDVGQKFAKKGLFGENRFYVSIIFEPETYDTVTWSDAKWMARHIAGINDADIRKAVSGSEWPDFAQEALSYRLINRRDQIAMLFDLGDGPTIPAPSLTIPLGTPEEISAAEIRYGLPAGSVAAELATIETGPGYSEAILSEGTIMSGTKSALVRALTKHAYPSGLASRYTLGKPPKALR
ncbi:MAG: hypothetical protein AAGD22_04420 [Verrucomicrobiota bacterium]